MKTSSTYLAEGNPFGITEGMLKEFVQLPVWKDFYQYVSERIDALHNMMEEEYKIDKIREHQGAIKELRWFLSYPEGAIQQLQEERRQQEQEIKE